MTSFDELIGAEPAGAERERLRSVHDLLLEAGPPPELTPELESGPTLAMTLSRWRKASRRPRALVLVAAAAVVLLALVIGLGTSLHGKGNRYPTLAMRGTSIGTGATGTLKILPAKKDGTEPMQLVVKGLPPLGKKRYVVYLVRNQKRVAPCGSFTVANATRETTVKLDSPYSLQSSDTWVITVHSPTGGTITVMQAIT